MDMKKIVDFAKIVYDFNILWFKSVHETVDTVNGQNYTDSNILCMG